MGLGRSQRDCVHLLVWLSQKNGWASLMGIGLGCLAPSEGKGLARTSIEPIIASMLCKTLGRIRTKPCAYKPQVPAGWSLVVECRTLTPLYRHLHATQTRNMHTHKLLGYSFIAGCSPYGCTHVDELLHLHRHTGRTLLCNSMPFEHRA